MLKTHVFTHHPPFHQLPNGSHASGFLKTPILCLACKRFPNEDAINSKQHRTGHSVTEKKEKRHRYTSHRVKSRKHSSTASARMPSGTYLPILSRHQCLIAVLNNGAGTSETLFARFNGFADSTLVPSHITLQHASFVSLSTSYLPSAPSCLARSPCDMQALCPLRHLSTFGTLMLNHIALQHASFVSHSSTPFAFGTLLPRHIAFLVPMHITLSLWHPHT
ncbi:hypothetical protein L3X38_038997 [Prunus dulcis]|uniref:Uncharacterized protein n=1 Tax=Prunus dulcis TaxID=3755 RepID=A0AAD4V685_PRUDU|nr:hypothetical protein L3X38_038997 [Prunus dulcis]